ncbi:glycosyltransferase family 2 protein [Myroides albus]|uniref:glycosyltransferase family 2 protein n=1 Tax=Myroides albus TaxID=2562892 RepID=UPI0021594CC5|nr:glycosyltransferase family 2 protein [Myroides albus]UVD79135.1 glycosyltransferase family 2 protein [Myroides albus]
MSMEISIICPTYNEEKYIDTCIDSLVKQDIDKEKIEVFFVDGNSTDSTVEIIKTYQKQYSWIKLLNNPERIVPYAMNYGIKASQSDIVMRIDAHSFYADNYISVLLNAIREFGATNVGAVCRTDVLNKNAKTLAIGEVLSNPFGVGNSLFRLGVDKITEVDTVPFGCYRKEVFDRYGLYNPKLVRNQDIELNKRIKRDGGRILLVPDTYCTYLARETYKALSKNNFQNGMWNILTVYYTNAMDSLSLRHFIPLLFVLSLVIPSLLGLIWAPFVILSVLSFVLYFLLVCIISIKAYMKNEVSICYMILTFYVLHISYGVGSLVGLKRVLFKQV